MHTSDRRATVPTGVRRVCATLLVGGAARSSDPLAGNDLTALPHRRARALPPPVA